jgi:1-acyl-sn-glycerol-3-phosphate acyltransferase
MRHPLAGSGITCLRGRRWPVLGEGDYTIPEPAGVRDSPTVSWSPSADGATVAGRYHDGVASGNGAARDAPWRSVEVPVTGTGSLVALERPDYEHRLGDVDEWGRSERMRSLARHLYDPVYRRWFRAEWAGLDKIPRRGGALIVANHAGGVPPDAPVIMHGIETELGRPVYGLADDLFRRVPVVGTLWSRFGGVLASPDNAYRLLRNQQLVLDFPEGVKGPAKGYAERYRLRRFGRGGFVEIAMRAGVPVIPVAVIGAEEAMPVLWTWDRMARTLGLPYAPVTLNALLFGPLGLALYFPAKFKLRVLDPVSFDVPRDQLRYSRSRILDEAEAIRGRLQDTLLEMLGDRRSIWFG